MALALSVFLSNFPERGMPQVSISSRSLVEAVSGLFSRLTRVFARGPHEGRVAAAKRGVQDT